MHVAVFLGGSVGISQLEAGAGCGQERGVMGHIGGGNRGVSGEREVDLAVIVQPDLIPYLPAHFGLVLPIYRA